MSTPQIHVCDHCLRRSCWEGLFMCDDSRTAGLVLKTEAQLDALDREHRSYYAPRFAEGGET